MTEHAYQRLTLDELRHYVPRDFAGIFEIEHIPLDEDGYEDCCPGRYYGVGIPVFVVWWEHGDRTYNRGVRAESHETLLEGLKLRWPSATTTRI